MWRSCSLLYSLKHPQCQPSHCFPSSVSLLIWIFLPVLLLTFSSYCTAASVNDSFLKTAREFIIKSHLGNTALSPSLCLSSPTLCMRGVNTDYATHPVNMLRLSRRESVCLEDWCSDDCRNWNSRCFHLCKGKADCAGWHRRWRRLVTLHRISWVLWTLSLGTSTHVIWSNFSLHMLMIFTQGLSIIHGCLSYLSVTWRRKGLFLFWLMESQASARH